MNGLFKDNPSKADTCRLIVTVGFILFVVTGFDELNHMIQQQAFIERYQGFEFDWFALDQEGNVGLFTSAGYSYVPLEVQQHYQVYDAITDEFILPRLGNSDVWHDYADHDLYVFDWHFWHGLYEKKATPRQKMSDNVRNRILHIPNLPKLSVCFAKTTSVSFNVR